MFSPREEAHKLGLTLPLSYFLSRVFVFFFLFVWVYFFFLFWGFRPLFAAPIL